MGTALATSSNTPSTQTIGVGQTARPEDSLNRLSLPPTTVMPRPRHAAPMHSITWCSSQAPSGFSGLSQLRPSVRAMGRAPEQATLSAASQTLPAPPAKGSQ